MDEKSVGLTVARRMRNGMNIEKMVSRIDRDHPDSVVQQYRIDSKTKSRQINLEATAYEAYNCIKPSFSMPVMVCLLSMDPYLAGAVEAIATNVSACECDVVWTGDGKEDKGARRALEEFFFESNDPENPMSIQEKIRVCAMDFITLGNWNLEIIMGGISMTDLRHTPAEYVRVIMGMTGYLMVKDGEKQEFSLYGGKAKAGQNPILRAINKRPGHRVYGKPAIYPLMNTVLMNSLRDEKNLAWFDQGLLSDLLILLEENIGEDVKKQITAGYQNTGDGESAMYLLHGVGKGLVKELKRTIEDESFDRMEKNNRQRVLSALRTPPAKVGIYEDANRANTITQDEVFRNEVVKPIQDTFRVRFNHLIKYGFGFPGWEFKIKPYSLKDRKEEADILNSFIDGGIDTVNEARAELNKPPVKGGDRRVINTPLGLVDLDTWTIAVADPKLTPQQEARLAKSEAGRLILRIMELRKELREMTHHEC